MDDARRRTYTPLVAILLFAAALQAVLWVRLPTISADGIIFIRIARELTEAPLATMRVEDQHPGFPMMLLAASQVVRWLGIHGEPDVWVLGGMIVSFVCGLLSVAVVWLFARDLFDEKIANVAAIGFTVLPFPRTLAVDAQSDVPHAFFYLLAAWLATTGLARGEYRRLAGAGLASGLAFWIRPEGLEVALVAVPVLAAYGWRAGWPWRRVSFSCAAVAGTALVVAAPYMVLAGKLTSKQLQFFKTKPAPTYLERLAEAEVSDPPARPKQPAAVAPVPKPGPAPKPPAGKPRPAPNLSAPPAPEARYSAALVLSVVGSAFAAFINSICQGLKFVFIPFYLFGDVALYWRRPAIVQIVFLSLLGALHIVVLMTVFVISGYIAHRHVIPLVGLAMPFAALGLVESSACVARRLASLSRNASANDARVGRLTKVCTAATLLVCCGLVMPYTLRRLNYEFVPVMEATAWIESRAEPGTGILCNSPYVKFYAKLPVAELSHKAPSLGEALGKAPHARYDYVVMHVNAYGYQPQWLDELAPHYRVAREFPDLLSHEKDRTVMVLEAKRPVRNAGLPSS
ncbi:MAG: hypothetical protein DWQ37_02185 [Planctomycetota bacterium]|nr:MAG: hypothetical protein DWQ37_02185 [Planctomycetota bacterium]